MVPVTNNFTSETPLIAASREALMAAFDQGWADPRKISQSSERAKNLRASSIESIANGLGVAPNSLTIIGEVNLAHYLALAGFLREDATFIYGAVDKGKIRAIAKDSKYKSLELAVDPSGSLIKVEKPVGRSVLSLQSVNGETGIKQNLANFQGACDFLVIDASISGNQTELPAEFSAALFNAQSWAGPAGLSILSIQDERNYIYPLPHLAPIKSPESYSLPLLIASAVALENFQYPLEKIRTFNSQIRNSLTAISGVIAVGNLSDTQPDRLSLLIADLQGEEVLRQLAKREIFVDSGSACTAADLAPSHVLAALGLPITGHIRISLHHDTESQEVSDLISGLIEVIYELRES